MTEEEIIKAEIKYELLEDKVQKLEEENKKINKGLEKVRKRRTIYHNRYLKEKHKNKELQTTVNNCKQENEKLKELLWKKELEKKYEKRDN